MEDGFFAFLESVRRPGDGFSLFGTAHLLFLAGIFAAVIFLCVLYRRCPAAWQPLFCRVVVCLCLGLEVVKQLVLFLTLPAYPVTQLPLHMCGMCIFIEVFHAFHPTKTTGEILYCLALPGAVAALLFANWSMYPIANFFCLQSFIIHGLHILYPLMLLTTGQLQPVPKNLWRPVVFLLITVPPIYLLNKVLNTNYLFVNAGSEGSPLEVLVRLMGNPGFLAGYAGLLAFVWLLMYLPYIIVSARKKKAAGP